MMMADVTIFHQYTYRIDQFLPLLTTEKATSTKRPYYPPWTNILLIALIMALTIIHTSHAFSTHEIY